jgi:hypothetical protein
LPFFLPQSTRFKILTVEPVFYLLFLYIFFLFFLPRFPGVRSQLQSDLSEPVKLLKSGGPDSDLRFPAHVGSLPEAKNTLPVFLKLSKNHAKRRHPCRRKKTLEGCYAE